jgi:hypothetical protein
MNISSTIFSNTYTKNHQEQGIKAYRKIAGLLCNTPISQSTKRVGESTPVLRKSNFNWECFMRLIGRYE